MPRKAAPDPLPAITTTLELLAHVAGPELMAAAIPLLRQRMDLTPEKLAILLEVTLNPHAFVKKGDECKLRGVHEETLKGYKEEKLFPEFIGAALRQD